MLASTYRSRARAYSDQLTQVITAAKNPIQMEAVAASDPCREEKNVPTRAGRAEPVKIPVMFCHGKVVSTASSTYMSVSDILT
jgi:hypothetical protein